MNRCVPKGPAHKGGCVLQTPSPFMLFFSSDLVPVLQSKCRSGCSYCFRGNYKGFIKIKWACRFNWHTLLASKTIIKKTLEHPVGWILARRASCSHSSSGLFSTALRPGFEPVVGWAKASPQVHSVLADQPVTPPELTTMVLWVHIWGLFFLPLDKTMTTSCWTWTRDLQTLEPPTLQPRDHFLISKLSVTTWTGGTWTGDLQTWSPTLNLWATGPLWRVIPCAHLSFYLVRFSDLLSHWSHTPRLCQLTTELFSRNHISLMLANIERFIIRRRSDFILWTKFNFCSQLERSYL